MVVLDVPTSSRLALATPIDVSGMASYSKVGGSGEPSHSPALPVDLKSEHMANSYSWTVLEYHRQQPSWNISSADRLSASNSLECSVVIRRNVQRHPVQHRSFQHHPVVLHPVVLHPVEHHQTDLDDESKVCGRQESCSTHGSKPSYESDPEPFVDPVMQLVSARASG